MFRPLENRALAIPLFAVLVALGGVGCRAIETESAPWSSHSEALTIHVPGDAATIQAGVDAASPDDMVQVAAGEYTENVTLGPGVILMGAGIGQTVIHGQLLLTTGDPQVVTGFTVTRDGASGLAVDVGIRKLCEGYGGQTILLGNQVEGFGVGIDLDDCPAIEITRNYLRRNGVGLRIAESVGFATDNLVVYNRQAGIQITGSTARLNHNTVVGNGFAASADEGGAGIASLARNSVRVHNNIVVSNNAGIASPYAGLRSADHNLVWGNFVNYAGYAVADATDVSLDPLFADIEGDDFHLRRGSPAIDAGTDSMGSEVDFDGLSRPKGAAVEMGAFEYRPAPAVIRPVISEVMSNPIDEDRGEFVEIYNAADTPLELAGLVLSDGDASDVLTAFEGGPTVVAAGAYAVIVDPEYDGAYGIPEGTTRVAPANTTLGNGLTTNDRITLYDTDGVTVLSTFDHPFDPGNGVSAERVDLEGLDVETNWRSSPCTQSAGRPNCAPITLAAGLVISEVMSNPLDERTGEFVELFNGSDDPVDVAGMQIFEGDSTRSTVDAIIAYGGGSTTVPARSYAVVLDPDWPDDQLFQVDPSAVLLTVPGAAIGDGLAIDDPIRLLSATDEVLDSYIHTLAASNGRSVEKVSLSVGDQVGNWAQSSCDTGSSPGRLNCVSEASAGSRKPLIITEVMANPQNEDTGEFIELYNRGIDPVDAAGLLVTDGDAIDVLGPYGGGSTAIPAGSYALIIDAEYAGEYEIPGGTVLLTTQDTTLGSGLSVSDAIRLSEANGVEIIDTFRSPFNPGNGVSAEKIDFRAFDSAANWTASTCAAGSSPGADNCAAVPAGLPKRVVFTEVMANQEGTEAGGAGEFVELFNLGANTIDLDGMWLAVGPEGAETRDRIQPRADEPTTLPPGSYAVVLDMDYDDRYAIPADAVLVTIDDHNFGASGLATTHWAALYDVDGITLLDHFRYPSDPGDGVSLYRISLTAADGAENWAATPCEATPGAGTCPGSVDVSTFTSFWVDRYASEGGIYWYQAIGWPEWHNPVTCELNIVCPGGLYGYSYRDNFPAPRAFEFRNPYADYAVVFTERADSTDDCGGIGGSGCEGASVTVGAGETAEVPASALGYYFARTDGPSLNSLDWFGGDPDRYWALPPDGILAPFTVEVPLP